VTEWNVTPFEAGAGADDTHICGGKTPIQHTKVINSPITLWEVLRAAILSCFLQSVAKLKL
jgi:hypothetical protein